MVLLASNYDRSRFFKAADLTSEKKLKIKSATEELIGVDKEKKLVIWFTNDERGLVLNKTTNRVLRGAFGDTCDGWTGKVIVLFPTTDDFRGKMVPVIRGASNTKRKRSELKLLIRNPISWKFLTSSTTKLTSKKLAAAPGSKQSRRLLLEQSHEYQRCKTYHISRQYCKTAACAGAADRAAAMGGVAVDAAAEREMAEAAVHGNTAGTARQHD